MFSLTKERDTRDAMATLMPTFAVEMSLTGFFVLDDVVAIWCPSDRA